MFSVVLFCLTLCDLMFMLVRLVNINPRTQLRYKHIKLWWSCYDKNIFHISFPILFWPKSISMMLISANKIPFSWESKIISKIMCSQKYGDLYVISCLIINHNILHVYATPILETLISTPFENNTSGKYITPPISFLKTFVKIIDLWFESII